MKNIGKIIGLVVLIAVAVGGFMLYKSYSGSDLYTVVAKEGTKENVSTRDGGGYVDYKNNLKAYDADGNEKDVEFYGAGGDRQDRPLKVGAFLKLSYNDGKGVLSWEEISKDNIPEKALAQLEKIEIEK